MSSTLRPFSTSAAPRLMVVVVLPTPPFWLHIAMTLALPWVVSGVGSGITGIGRPVGPSSPGVSWTTAASGSGARGAMGSNGLGSGQGGAAGGGAEGGGLGGGARGGGGRGPGVARFRGGGGGGGGGYDPGRHLGS